MIRRFALVVLCAVLVAGTGARPVRAAGPYEINVLLSLSGPGAFIGQSEAKTIGAVETLVNKSGGIKGRPVHFVLQDDQSSPQVAVQLTNGLIAKQVPVMMGPGYSATCYALLPIVKNGPVQYCFTPSVHTTAPSFTFSSGVSTKDLALAGMRYFRDRGIKKVALLVTTDSTGQDGENVVRDALARRENESMQLVATEHFNPNDIAISAQMSRLKSSGAQLIVAWVAGTPFGTVLKAAVDGGIDVPMLTNAGNLSYVQMAQYAAFVPKDLYFTGFRSMGYKTAGPGPVRDAEKRWLDVMHDIGVAKPDVQFETAWDPSLIIVDALRHLGTNATADQVRTYIANLHGYVGINGIMDFRDGQQRGLTDTGALIVRWDTAAKDWIPVSKPGGRLK